MVMLVKVVLHLASVADQEPDPSGSELICRICVIRKLKEVKHISAGKLTGIFCCKFIKMFV